MKKTVLAIGLFLVIGYVLNFSTLFAVYSSTRDRTLGGQITVYSRYEEPINICAGVDAVQPMYNGWPLWITEDFSNDCQTYSAEPNNYLKIYPLAIAINALVTGVIAGVIVYAFVKIIQKKGRFQHE